MVLKTSEPSFNSIQSTKATLSLLRVETENYMDNILVLKN